MASLWTRAAIIGVGGFFLARYRFWLVFPVLAFALLLAWVQIGELNDPFVGPDILREAGRNYWSHSHVTIAISLLVPAIGAAVGWARTTQRAT